MGLSKIFKFLNDTLIVVSFAQEKDTFDKLVQIKALIDFNKDRDDALDNALGERRKDSAFPSSELVPPAVLYNTSVGTVESKDVSNFTEISLHQVIGGTAL